MTDHIDPTTPTSSTSPWAHWSRHPRTREEAIEQAGRVLAQVYAAMDSMTPREQAEAAWTPTSRFSVDELEDRIRARRGLPALDRGPRL